jgi:hypothetical protein
MLENITAGTCIYMLSQLEDENLTKFWGDVSTGKYPIIDLEGNLSYSLLDQDGLQFIRNDFMPTIYTGYEFVFGNVFLSDTTQELLTKDRVLILIVYSKTTQNLLLSELAVDIRYMIDLPHGKYSFFVLILDAKAKSLLDSKIYAIGFPCKGDLNNPELENVYLEHPFNTRDFIDATPIEIKHGGPFYINLIVMDTSEIPDFDMLISNTLIDK